MRTPHALLGVALVMSLSAGPLALAAPASPAGAGASATAPHQPHAGEIAAGLRRLGVVGSVLYVAAHPDDENTRLLAAMAGGRGLRAGYLSLTRGDGGQNLIGTEQDALLGLIRTHELLAARRIDGAEQLFTRARDFGFSKSAEESLRLWGHQEVLADVVLALRRFRPDVVVTRFSTRPPNHGHHTASALLAAEAFRAAADPARFPEQLADGTLTPWKADRLLHNTASWALAPGADLSAFLKEDVGGYDPLTGRSWGEVAAASRSQHKSQGFGVPAERGPLPEHFEPLDGTRPKAGLLEGLDLSWRRFPGGDVVQRAVDLAVAGFDARTPHRSLPALLAVHRALSTLPADNPWRALKLAEVERLALACAGLFLEARAPEPSAVPGDAVALRLEALNRSPASVRLLSVTLPGAAGPETGVAAPLEEHAPLRLERKVALPADAPVSTPYWLRRPVEGALYTLEGADRALTGQPEGPPALAVRFEVEVAGLRLTAERPVVHVWTDPVRGELYRAFEVVPAVTATLGREALTFPNGAPKDVRVVLAAGKAGVKGAVRLALPPGWRAEPAQHPFALEARGDERTVSFRIHPAAGAATAAGASGAPPPARLRVVTEVAGREESWRERTISYEHLPPLAVRQPSEARLVAFPLATGGKRLGYIPGPGDLVAESLAAVGYEVTLLPEERLARESLERFDAILVGVRAFNANPRLGLQKERLLKYVQGGGRLVVQYQTTGGRRGGNPPGFFAPFPLELGRERVTDETAALAPLGTLGPALLKGPNALTPADFEGWVQERGLYFAQTWDKKLEPAFAVRDPDEAPLEGALVSGRHGKGTYTYTGLAFFRQLPAGVPGAYRLLANILAR
jgi:LmbE family N-acetylglucosaminyl deacetylase